MSAGKDVRQTRLRPFGRNQTPPIPAKEASHAPMQVGRSGTTSATLVGRLAREWAKTSKSSRCERMAGVIRTQWRSLCRKPSCRVLKRPRPPGMARTMLRNSPSILCQRLTETRVRPWSSLKMS